MASTVWRERDCVGRRRAFGGGWVLGDDVDGMAQQET
jgi:hypothetical protein